ncbi:ankyrin repeat-containing domain protein [Biscogniauxia sp. FL1348]|nr:ankyrin repeat-containing domain protein [Biscogniauxia sp. FL1348]
MAPITRLPDSVLLVLGDFLETADLKAMMRTCRQMHRPMTLALYRNDVRSGYNYALVQGCIRGNLAVVSQAVQSGAPVNPSSHREWHKMLPRLASHLPLTLSIAVDRIDILCFLLENGAAPNYTHYKHPLTMALELYKEHPLSQHGRIKDIITRLLQHGADPYEGNSINKQFPLLFALKEYVPLDAFRLLVDKVRGVKFPLFDRPYLWEFHIHIHRWHNKDRAMEKCFLLYCANMCKACSKPRCLPTLQEIIRYGNHNALYALKGLLRKGADPNARTSTLPGSALWAVCKELHGLNFAETGPNRRYCTNSPRTARVFRLMAKALLDAGASPECTEEEYQAGLQSPLVLLCSGVLFFPDVVTDLLRYNPDVNRGDQHNRTALYWVLAKQTHYPQIVKQLLDHGADPNAVALNDLIPLRQAVMYCGGRPDHRLDIVKMLVEAGADVNLQERWGGGIMTYVDDRDEQIREYLTGEIMAAARRRVEAVYRQLVASTIHFDESRIWFSYRRKPLYRGGPPP